jgi:outer membrane receptor for Fe3+-dicitrate
VFKPVEPVSIYASYSRSYLPQSGDQFLSLDLTSAALEPEKFDNYELGLKWAIRPALLFTAALYQLDRTNTRAPLSAAWWCCPASSAAAGWSCNWRRDQPQLALQCGLCAAGRRDPLGDDRLRKRRLRRGPGAEAPGEPLDPLRRL